MCLNKAPPVCFCMDTDSLPFQSPALAQPKFHSQLGALRPLGRYMACTHTNQILNRQLLFQHQTTQIYNPVFFCPQKRSAKAPSHTTVQALCVLKVDSQWRKTLCSEGLLLHRPELFPTSLYSNISWIYTSCFLIMISLIIGNHFSDFLNYSCASTPVGNLNLQT